MSNAQLNITPLTSIVSSERPLILLSLEFFDELRRRHIPLPGLLHVTRSAQTILSLQDFYDLPVDDVAAGYLGVAVTYRARNPI